MDEYKVSIIIPIYNAGKYLEDTINNVMGQSIGFENIELILIDDYSKDDSKSIIEKYANKYPNIKPIFLESNSGHPSFPRNIGLKNVTAPFIIFLDSDDAMYFDYCETLYNIISANDVDIVNCNHTSKLNDELYIPVDIDPINSSSKTLSDDSKLIVNPTVWGNIYRTSFFRENNIEFLHILFEDLVFSIYCLLKTKKDVIYLQEYPGYIYLIENKDSITHKVDMKTLNDFLTAMDLIYSLLKANCTEDTKINLLNDMMNMVFFILSKLDDPKAGIKKLYEFESKLDFDLTPLSAPFNMLNKVIMKKHFNISLFLTKIMGLLYNNKKIRNFLFLKYKGIKKLDDSRYLKG